MSTVLPERDDPVPGAGEGGGFKVRRRTKVVVVLPETESVTPIRETPVVQKKVRTRLTASLGVSSGSFAPTRGYVDQD